MNQLKRILTRPADIVDPLWQRVREEAEHVVQAEPQLSSFIFANILQLGSLEGAVIQRIASRLDHPDLPGTMISQAFIKAIESEPFIATAIRADMLAVVDRDPAASRYIDPILYFKGFHALETYRLANWLLREGRRDFALYLQSRSSAVFQCDLNPAARIGKSVFLDHGTGVVVGETAVIEDDVSILHEVTLGGTGKEAGDRHPKIRRGVMIGAGAKILGNIEIGRCARVAAGSVVLKDVPRNTTVAGVPARVVGEAGCSEPSHSMDQILHAPFPTDSFWHDVGL